MIVCNQREKKVIYYQQVLEALKKIEEKMNMSIKSIIINSNTFRNVNYNQEKAYLEKTLNAFKLSYPNDETVIIYEKSLVELPLDKSKGFVLHRQKL